MRDITYISPILLCLLCDSDIGAMRKIKKGMAMGISYFSRRFSIPDINFISGTFVNKNKTPNRTPGYPIIVVEINHARFIPYFFYRFSISEVNSISL